MTFNACKHCGLIQENATIKINRLVKKIEERLYLWQYGDALDVRGKSPKSDEIFQWKEDLKQILKEF